MVTLLFLKKSYVLVCYQNSNFVLGHLWIHPPPLRPPSEGKEGSPSPSATTTFVDRSITPLYMYAGEKFPDFLSGSLYVIPRG